MDVFGHFKDVKIISLQLFGIDLSITNAVITLWIAVAIIFLFFFLASRKTRLVPKGMQNIAEAIFDFVYIYLLDVFEDVEDKNQWAPFIMSLFLFILTVNLLSLIPGVFPSTLNINLTAALAIMVFIVYQIAGMKKLGAIGYFKTFFPKGVNVAVSIVLFPIEMISQFARPFSLAVRLFANVLAGHIMALMFISLIFLFNIFITPFSVTANVLVNAFEIFVASIQAYIFAYLTAIYIAFAIKPEH